MKIKWLVILFILLACNSRKQEKTTNTSGDSINRRNEITTIRVPHTFWDSISMGIKLSHKQIEKYTDIESHWSMDSFYIARYDSVEFKFKETLGIRGDSTFTTAQKFRVAILAYSGPNCLEKYLLVFDSTGRHTISSVLIEEGCDGDGEDSPYSSQEYKILTDSTFETIETYDPGDADKTDRNITTTITGWKISNKGAIDSIQDRIIRKRPKD